MKILEKILIKLYGNTKGLDFNIWDWDSITLSKKLYYHMPLTKSELYALQFFEKIGEQFELVGSIKK